jgi:drug/metabolite transporter (DMT)-like permease
MLVRKQITRVSPVQTAKVFAALSLIGSLAFLLIAVIPMMSMSGERPAFFTPFLLFVPVIYAGFGFVLTLVGALLYNFVAKHLGGVEFTMVDAGEP